MNHNSKWSHLFPAADAHLATGGSVQEVACLLAPEQAKAFATALYKRQERSGRAKPRNDRSHLHPLMRHLLACHVKVPVITDWLLATRKVAHHERARIYHTVYRLRPSKWRGVHDSVLPQHIDSFNPPTTP